MTHSSTEQPAINELCQWFNEGDGFKQGTAAPHKWVLQANSEISRQHARIEELEAQLSAIGAGGVEPLRKPPAAQAVPPVPPFTPLAQRKLDDLLAQGFRVTGYSIERPDVADWSPQRGFVTHDGLVGWWTPPADPKFGEEC